MDDTNDGAGAETPVQDKALASLAALLEEIGHAADEAWLRNGEGDEARYEDCARRAETVVRCIVGLPAISLNGASAKARAARTSGATVLLERSLVDRLASDMHDDIVRLRAPMEGAGHA